MAVFDAFFIVAIIDGKRKIISDTSKFVAGYSVTEEMKAIQIDAARFCFPSTNVPRQVISPAQSFSFVITSRKERCYGFARRLLPLGMNKSTDTGFRHPICLCFLTRLPMFSFFNGLLQTIAVRGFFNHKAIGAILKEVIESPIPSPGQKFKITMNPLDSDITVSETLVRHRDDELKLIDIPLEPLCSRFQHVSAFINLFSAVLCEHRIICVSNNVERLAACCHGLVSSLMPLEWPHTFVPVVPNEYLHVLCSPLPYICGILKEDQIDALSQPIGESLMVDFDAGHLMVTSQDYNSPCRPMSLDDTLEWAGVCLSTTSLSKDGSKINSKSNPVTPVTHDPAPSSAGKTSFFKNFKKNIKKAVKKTSSNGLNSSSDCRLRFEKSLKKSFSLIRKIGHVDEAELRSSFVCFFFQILEPILSDLPTNNAQVGSRSRPKSGRQCFPALELVRKKLVRRFSSDSIMFKLLTTFCSSQMFEQFVTGHLLQESRKSIFDSMVSMASSRGSNDMLAIVPKAMRALKPSASPRIRSLVFTATSNSPSSQPIHKVYPAIAKSTYSQQELAEITTAINDRLNDCAGRSWRHAAKTCHLIHFLCCFGSDLFLAEAMDWQPKIFELTKHQSFLAGRGGNLQVRSQAHRVLCVLRDWSRLEQLRDRSLHCLSASHLASNPATAPQVVASDGIFDTSSPKVASMLLDQRVYSFWRKALPQPPRLTTPDVFIKSPNQSAPFALPNFRSLHSQHPSFQPEMIDSFPDIPSPPSEGTMSPIYSSSNSGRDTPVSFHRRYESNTPSSLPNMSTLLSGGSSMSPVSEEDVFDSITSSSHSIASSPHSTASNNRSYNNNINSNNIQNQPTKRSHLRTEQVIPVHDPFEDDIFGASHEQPGTPKEEEIPTGWVKF
eukprot:TRINITY_DN13116_c0_g1_i1.p1 TRINITY_DN13116_c0_g1~~TRINITY_DN13116_c0_g1_i1.p1  ORF type:complete len:893 (-),score=242.23 TRINITY_DN13116_c0_g1_i1:170-2848(-)